MNLTKVGPTRSLARRLLEAEATIQALLTGQIDAVVDAQSQTPVLLSIAQGTLRESEERYRRIVETANEGIWTIDSESKITFANQRLAEMLGYQLDEMLGRSLFEFMPHERAGLRVLHLPATAPEEFEIGFARRDGSELWALLKTSPIRDRDGTYVGMLAMMTDRTRHRHDEVALRKSEEQYRQIVEATSDGIVKIDPDGSIVFVNRRFAQMLGYQAQEMIGISIFAFMSAEARPVAADFIQSQGPAQDSLDATLRHKNGGDVSVNIASTALVDGKEQHAGNLAVVRDVTERKKLQSQLMVSDRMASVGTLAAGVAHEINNPLAAVLANLDYIDETLTAMAAGGSPPDSATNTALGLLDKLRAALEDAREAGQRVRFIVRDLKLFSRSPVEEPRCSVDARAVMESSLRMAWNEVRHRARVVKHYEVVPNVEANEARLGQVFLNLVVNAAQALPEGRAEQNEIRVSTRSDGGRVIVEVSDTGEGIEPELQSRIFDAFFTTKEMNVGNGLGLAICQRLVTEMKGELTVESQVGHGTTFRVALPVALEQNRATPIAELAPVARRRGRVLVIDDEQLVVHAVQRILCREHEVVAAVVGAEAVALCVAGEKFDLILCDLMMPDMTGVDLHRELSRLAPDQAARMIFMTGGAFTETARLFLSELASEHLDKPFDPEGLRALVQRHLK